MKHFKVIFIGRKIGVIDIFSTIRTTIEMPERSTVKQVELQLHNWYEHVFRLNILE